MISDIHKLIESSCLNTWQLEEQVSGLPTGSGLTLDNEVNDLVEG